MNTKILMTVTSLVLALAGVSALFAPDVLLSMLGVSVTKPLSVLVQLMGALYFSFALMNWTAKDSAIGGIYARPVSLANFGYFFMGALLLIRYQISAAFNLSVFLIMLIHVIFASLFYWLVFRATGVGVGGSDRENKLKVKCDMDLL
jgi:hypothetical protein